MKKEHVIETIFILIFAGIMLWIGLADTWGHKIQHDFPYSYLASDTFQHQTRAQWIKDTGNYKYEAPYYSSGYTDVVGYYPPILNHVSVLFSNVSRLEIYDSILFLTVIFAIFGTLIFYLIVRQWNRNIAILSMPLTTYLFTIREARVAFFWGHWPALLGDFFLIATCWMLINLQKKHSGIILGLLLAGTVLGHTAAAIFTALFITIFFTIARSYKKFEKKQLKDMLVAFIVLLFLTTYFLILFRQTWMVVFPFTFQIWTDWEGGGGFISLAEFGIPLLTFLILGLLCLIFSKNQDNFFQKVLCLFSIGAGFTNYVGFSNRAFNFRFYWPILLSILFGTGIYNILKIIIKELTLLKSIIITMIIVLLLIHNNYQTRNQQEGLMNQYTWQTLNWIKDNTEKDAKIFFFYGDPYDQDGILGNTHRKNTRAEIKDLSETWKNKKIERAYPTKELIEGGTELPYKKGFLSYKLHLAENPERDARQTRDLCSFNYYVFDKSGLVPQLTSLNHKIAKVLLTNNFTKIFNNNLTFVLKNPQQGGDCFGTNNTIQF